MYGRWRPPRGVSLIDVHVAVKRVLGNAEVFCHLVAGLGGEECPEFCLKSWMTTSQDFPKWMARAWATCFNISNLEFAM